jgi:peptidyl-prolyl cis-trans isomerase D
MAGWVKLAALVVGAARAASTLIRTEIEMFEAVRNNKRIAQLILAILIVPFAFFGMDAYFADGPAGTEVATVGGTAISMMEFEQALRDQQDRVRNAGGELDRAMLESDSFRMAVLQNLISQRVLALYAAENRFVVTPQELQQTIAGVPTFQEDGRFSLQRYEAVLRAQGMSPQSFEARLAQDVRIQQLALPVGETAFSPAASAQRFLLAQLEEREVRELRFAADAYLDQVALADDAVAKYYEADPARFERPARLKAEYVVFDQAALEGQVTVSGDEVRAYYDANQDRFGLPEERQARHILLQLAADAPADEVEKVRAKAVALVAELRQDPSRFEALAKEQSQDPGSAERGGDLGFFGRGAMVKAFEDAAFAQQQGEIGEPVRSDFGFHIIQVTAIKPGSMRAFAEVHDEIATELRRQAAGRRFAELAETFANTVYEQPDSLQPVAEALKLEIRTSDWVSRGAESFGPYRSERLVSALFADDAVRNRRNTEAVEVGPNALVAARVVEFEAAQRLPLDAVRGQIEATLRAEEAGRIAAREGAAVLDKLSAGGEAGRPWGELRSLTRGAPTLPAPAMQAVFGASAASLPAHVGVALPEGGYAIYRIEAVKRPTLEKDDPRLQAVRAQYARLLGARDFDALLGELRRRYEVQVKLPPVAAAAQ